MNIKESKILINLSSLNASIQLEYKSNSTIATNKNESKELKVETIKLNNTAKLNYDVIPFILNLSIAENIDFIQLFDTSMLLNNAAFDDNSVMECVLEKIGEWKQYPRAMAIFDVDSLIGVSENTSDSNKTISYSIINNRLWHQVVISTVNDLLEPYDSTHKWIVVISKHEFICKQFKSLTCFP